MDCAVAGAEDEKSAIEATFVVISETPEEAQPASAAASPSKRAQNGGVSHFLTSQ